MVDSGSAAVEPGRTHVIRDARDIDPVWSQCPILRCSSLLHRGSGSPPRQLWGCRMKSGLQENASSSGSPAEPVGGFAASMAAQLTAPVEGFHGEPPISPATADDDFAKNLATKFAARFERLRAGAPRRRHPQIGGILRRRTSIAEKRRTASLPRSPRFAPVVSGSAFCCCRCLSLSLLWSFGPFPFGRPSNCRQATSNKGRLLVSPPTT